jgi:hypothetical protein
MRRAFPRTGGATHGLRLVEAQALRRFDRHLGVTRG